MHRRSQPNDLGRAIRRLRGLRSQATVARLAEIDLTSWSRYELGRQHPKPEKFELLAQGLGVTLEQLHRTVAEEAEKRIAGLLEDGERNKAGASPWLPGLARSPAESTSDSAAVALVLALRALLRAVVEEARG
jgi:transcriptional regulator with XRE-family HTH domain